MRVFRLPTPPSATRALALAVLLSAVAVVAADGGRDTDKAVWDAASDGDVARVKRLVEAGGNVNGEANSDCTPLHIASNNGHLGVVEVLVSDHGADMNRVTDFGSTPLMLAAMKNHSAVVAFLAKNGAALNVREGLLGYTALHWAVDNDRLADVQALVEAGADTKILDDVNATPLDLATTLELDAIVQYLRAAPLADRLCAATAEKLRVATNELRAVRANAVIFAVAVVGGVYLLQALAKI